MSFIHTKIPAPRAYRTGRILGILAAAAFMAEFVEMMLVPALPKLSTFFGGAPYTTVAWVLSAFFLVAVGT